MALFTPISLFSIPLKDALSSQSSLLLRSRRHALLSTREGQDLARQTLSAVAAYVRYCREEDDDPLSVRDARTINYLESLAATPDSLLPPANPKPLLAGLRTARSLMKEHDLWLGYQDTDRRVILAALGELGFHLPDHSIDSDPGIASEDEAVEL